MKKYLFILSAVVICLVFSSCNRVSGDPQKDADKLADELIEVSKDYDVEKLNDVLNKYIKYYENAPLKDRVKFLRYFKYSKRLEDNESFERMTRKESFQNSPAVKDMDMFYRATRKEAREADIWD